MDLPIYMPSTATPAFSFVSRPSANNGFADELAQITEESMLMMQRNVFERLRPLECSTAVQSSQLSGTAGLNAAGDASGGGGGGSSGGGRSSGSSGHGKRSMKSGRASGARAGSAAADSSAEVGRDSKPAISFACLIGMVSLKPTHREPARGR